MELDHMNRDGTLYLLELYATALQQEVHGEADLLTELQDAVDEYTELDHEELVDSLRYPELVVTNAQPTDRDGVLAAVSGPGELATSDLHDRLVATEPHETLESLVARIKETPDAERAGAIATFTGRVRAKDSADDERTEQLEFEKYEGVADRRMAQLQADLEGRDGVFAVELHHRTGVVKDGEDIVFVVVLAGHREEAFETVEDGINRLKDEVPLFKKEVTVGDEFWVHER
jgi:molybdopterin synthase catalytic subunit